MNGDLSSFGSLGFDIVLGFGSASRLDFDSDLFEGLESSFSLSSSCLPFLFRRELLRTGVVASRVSLELFFAQRISSLSSRLLLVIVHVYVVLVQIGLDCVQEFVISPSDRGAEFVSEDDGDVSACSVHTGGAFT